MKKYNQYTLENHFKIPVVIGTHPIPLKYLEAHENLSFWQKTKMEDIAGGLMKEDREIMESYN